MTILTQTSVAGPAYVASPVLPLVSTSALPTNLLKGTRVMRGKDWKYVPCRAE